MDRKWRLNRGAHETVESPIDFKRNHVDVLDTGGHGAGTTDLQRLVDVYALYTVLHIEKRDWTLHWSDAHRLYYFITETRVDGDVDGGNVVGMVEDEGSGEENDENDKNDDNDENGENGDIHDDKSDDEAGKRDTKETVFCDAPPGVDGEGGLRSHKQVLVPISSGNRSLTPRVLHSLCILGKGVAQQVLLSVVDSNGTATRCCLYDYIQGPLSARGVEATLA